MLKIARLCSEMDAAGLLRAKSGAEAPAFAPEPMQPGGRTFMAGRPPNTHAYARMPGEWAGESAVLPLRLCIECAIFGFIFIKRDI